MVSHRRAYHWYGNVSGASPTPDLLPNRPTARIPGDGHAMHYIPRAARPRSAQMGLSAIGFSLPSLVHELQLAFPFPEVAHERQRRLGRRVHVSLSAFDRRKRPPRVLVDNAVSTSGWCSYELR